MALSVFFLSCGHRETHGSTQGRCKNQSSHWSHNAPLINRRLNKVKKKDLGFPLTLLVMQSFFAFQLAILCLSLAKMDPFAVGPKHARRASRGVGATFTNTINPMTTPFLTLKHQNAPKNSCLCRRAERRAFLKSLCVLSSQFFCSF